MTNKAVISNRIYFGVTPERAKEIMDILTYKIETVRDAKGRFNTIELIRNYKIPAKGVISVPQGRLDLIPEGAEIVDKRSIVPVIFPEPKFALFPDQQEVYDQVTDTVFINALVGWGKTMTALHLAGKFQQKTLVITHNTMLRDQWIGEIKKLYGIEAGIIGSGRCDLDSIIVVGNVQTVTKMVTQLADKFGTVILDEAHHVPADTFGKIIDGMRARYRIALSGTLNRKDGKQVLFKDYFGSNIIKPKQSNTINPTIHTLKTGMRLLPGVPWVKKINALLYDYDYQQFIAGVAQRYINKGHKVLVVASRVEFLQGVKNALGDSALLVVGGTELKDRQAAEKAINTGAKQAIVGSRQIFAEGISINALSCLILAEPISNDILLEQLIGRVMRLHSDKLDPVVVDMHFSGVSEKKQNATRLAFYIQKGWQVVEL